MNAIEFLKVTKIFRKGFLGKKIPAVVDCSFSVESRAITGFVGPNGAGKTTSIKMIMGLVRPSSGMIRVFDKDPADPLCRKDIAFISEQPYFYNHLTVGETLAFAARLHGCPLIKLNDEIDASLSKVGLPGMRRRKIRELSKGMQQRCAMAQALLVHANTFVLDEPLSGLDPMGRSLFRSLLESIARSGATIFFSTHILDDIELLCRNVVVLFQGRLQYQGSLTGLLENNVKGTDVTIPVCPQSTVDELRRMGAEVNPQAGDVVRLFVPIDKDITRFQRFFLEQGIACESISKRIPSLEEILYSKNQG